MKKETSQKRLLNIARRMLFDHEMFFTQDSPRMSMTEYDALRSLGFAVQSEWPHPPECRFFYMMYHARNENLELYRKLKVELNLVQPAAKGS